MEGERCFGVMARVPLNVMARRPKRVMARRPKHVMARLDRAITRSLVLLLMARSSRAMTNEGRCLTCVI
jgi:hypothetical protein